jgi:2-polyprenyl-6-methoxyphenol hydroxylase-like FAD-dependent oxidoreductase
VPAIERLGLAPLLERAGAVRSAPAAWSPFGGWLLRRDDAPRGYGITRRSLDPMVRELAAQTPGVELILGQKVVGVATDGETVAGVEVEGIDRARRRLAATLTVAADGRYSTLAQLARVPARITPHNRFVYFGYWRGVDTSRDEARLWFLDPDAAAVFPNEDGIAMLAVVPHKRRLDEFRADPESAYRREIASLPDGPAMEEAELISKLIGGFRLPNRIRPAAGRRMAFVGDAALATDPLFGVGCGWAFQSAEWLVERMLPAVLGSDDLDRALKRYRRAFLLRLGPHHLQIADYATARPLRLNERLAFAAAAKDPVVGTALEDFATRRRSALRLLDPRLNARVLRAQMPNRSVQGA